MGFNMLSPPYTSCGHTVFASKSTSRSNENGMEHTPECPLTNYEGGEGGVYRSLSRNL